MPTNVPYHTGLSLVCWYVTVHVSGTRRSLQHGLRCTHARPATDETFAQGHVVHAPRGGAASGDGRGWLLLLYRQVGRGMVETEVDAALDLADLGSESGREEQRRAQTNT
ncbi:hypothetical protein BHE74_00040628 [Ensete ventricosum]|nr:hypothetical protein BHE74_00040628 [Ensete ventricosum]